MTDYASPQPMAAPPKRARNWLSLSAKTWFVVTAIGQWLFVLYIMGFYGTRFVNGGVAGFADTHLPNGYVEGDTVGNIAIVTHILVAGLIIAAGQLQLIPAIRAKVPRLHRWAGRFYMVASVAVSIAGAYLVWSRERVIGSFIQDVALTLDGVLVVVFAYLAYKYARQRDFAAHRRWALRLFMVVSAVWFLRLMIFGWFAATGGVGIDAETFSGPFLYIVGFAQYLLPLLVLEVYFRAERPQNKAMRPHVAGLVFVMTGLMAFGIAVVSAGLWIPRIF